MFTIGEFSRITGITVKALRHYHDEGLLAPSLIDPRTGYRYYAQDKIEPARVIAFLRQLGFPLADIRQILASAAGDDDESLLGAMERHKSALRERITGYRKVIRSIDQFLQHERQVRTVMATQTPHVEEKTLPPVQIAGVRMRGRYADCGKGFARIGRAMGRHIAGKPMLLHYDSEYRETDADFEAAMPVRPAKSPAADGIDLRQLSGGRC
ncbi:MAG TPA: MerR family transcriptional regulator, partial [Tepidisphaeraceae bacterium]